MELFLNYVFMVLLGLMNMNELILDYSLQLAIVIYLYASMEKFFFVMCGLPTMCDLSLFIRYFIYVTLI